jgi:arylsulfatase A-like enzyme
MDLLPTLAKLLEVELSAERPIDGHDIWPLMTDEAGATSPYEAFYCYYGRELQAVRDRRWKLHLPHSYVTLAGEPGGRDGDPVEYHRREIGLELFDLHNDVGETTNVADQHPDVVERLSAAAEKARAELGDVLTGREGSAVRQPGRARNRQRQSAPAAAAKATDADVVR